MYVSEVMLTKKDWQKHRDISIKMLTPGASVWLSPSLECMTLDLRVWAPAPPWVWRLLKNKKSLKNANKKKQAIELCALTSSNH